MQAFFITHVQVQFRLFTAPVCSPAHTMLTSFWCKQQGLTYKKKTVIHFSSLFSTFSYPAFVLRATYLLTLLRVLCSLPFQAAIWSHYAFSQFFQCNRSFQPCSSLCLMLLYCLDPVTAKSCLLFRLFCICGDSKHTGGCGWWSRGVGIMKGGSKSRLNTS